MSGDDQRAWELLRLHRPKDAAAAAREALGREPEDPGMLTLLALACSEMGETDAAIASAERAVAIAPDKAFSHFVLASVLTNAGRWKPAMTSVENALEIAPDHDASHALHAQLLFFRNEHVQALDAIDQALRLDSENPVHHAVRAKVLLTMGRRNDAAESVAAGLRLAPEHPELLALCGTLHLRQANAAQAAEAYLAALRHDPSDEQAREGLLEALRGRHRVYREILRMRQGLLGLLKQHGMVPIFLALVTCAIGVRLIAGSTGYNWVRGTLIAVLLVPKELANTFLLLHPIGRHALTRTEKVVAACVAIALLASAVLAILAWLTAAPALADAARAIGGLVLFLSFCHAISARVRLTRAAKIRITILVLIALALLLTVLATR